MSSAPLHSGWEASFHSLGALRQINRMGLLGCMKAHTSDQRCVDLDQARGACSPMRLSPQKTKPSATSRRRSQELTKHGSAHVDKSAALATGGTSHLGQEPTSGRDPAWVGSTPTPTSKPPVTPVLAPQVSQVGNAALVEREAVTHLAVGSRLRLRACRCEVRLQSRCSANADALTVAGFLGRGRETGLATERRLLATVSGIACGPVASPQDSPLLLSAAA